LAENQGWRFAVFSAENMPVSEHMEKLAEKYIRKPFHPGPTERMSRTEADRAITWLDQHFTFLLPEEPSPSTLIGMCRQLVKTRGINGIILDPWNELDHQQKDTQTETQYISETLSLFRKFARNHEVHLWIVAHPRQLQKRKDSDKEPIPTPYEVSGS